MRKISSPLICERSPRRHAYLAVAAMLAAASPSWAEPPSPAGGASTLDATAAEARFASGIKLFKSGKPAEALPHFRDAADATGSPNARLYVGHCLLQVGKYVDAYKAFALVIKQTSQRPDQKYEPTREAAVAQLALLEARVAKVVISLAEVPAKAAVILDGAVVEEKELGLPIVVQPGMHQLEATGNGVSPIHREVNVEAGEFKTTTLLFKKLEEDKPAVTEASPLSESGDGRSSAARTMRTASYVSAGVGVAGLAVFAITGLMAKNSFDRLSAECGTAGCSDPSQLRDIDQGKSLQTTANVGLVVGLLGVAAGGTLFVLGNSQSSDGGAKVSLSPGGGVFSYTRKF